MDRLEIDNILNVDVLLTELEFERATSLYGRLRWMAKEDSSLDSIRQHVKRLIQQYEQQHWHNEANITDAQIKESDTAEKIVISENTFIQKRKELIKESLKKTGLSQKDLAKLLGHRPNYMSELINGIRPFSKDDIVVLHRLLSLDFNDLIPTFLKSEVRNHIKSTLEELKNTNIKLSISDFELAE